MYHSQLSEFTPLERNNCRGGVDNCMYYNDGEYTPQDIAGVSSYSYNTTQRNFVPYDDMSTGQYASIQDVGPLTRQTNIKKSGMRRPIAGDGSYNKNEDLLTSKPKVDPNAKKIKELSEKIEQMTCKLDYTLKAKEEAEMSILTPTNLMLPIGILFLILGSYYMYQKYNTGVLGYPGSMNNNVANNKYIIIFCVFILVSVIGYVFFYDNEAKEGFGLPMTTHDLSWKHKDAAAQLDVLIDRYGQPAHLSRTKGGIAIWETEQLKDTCYHKIELHDESIVHLKPIRHRDFLYTFINYEVPPEKLLDILSLSGSVSYDPLTKLLRTRCGSEDANIATLALATQIGEGNVSINYIQENEMYKAWLKGTKNPKNVQKMYDLLCHNVKNQKGDPKPEGYFALAFPEGI